MYESAGDRFTRAVVAYSEAVGAGQGMAARVAEPAVVERTRREYVDAGYAFLAALGRNAPEEVWASVRRAERALGGTSRSAA